MKFLTSLFFLTLLLSGCGEKDHYSLDSPIWSRSSSLIYDDCANNDMSVLSECKKIPMPTDSLNIDLILKKEPLVILLTSPLDFYRIYPYQSKGGASDIYINNYLLVSLEHVAGLKNSDVCMKDSFVFHESSDISTSSRCGRIWSYHAG